MKKPLQQKPPYPIESVDNALRLIQMLRDGGDVRLTDASQELQVAPSTAHRLMAMLVYRGFAMQDDRRRYVAGPALGVRAIGAPWLHQLRRLAQTPMEVLCSRVGETVNLVVRVGVSIRFLLTVEAASVLRIGDRGGTVMPAIGASSGKALLALESEDRLRNLYTSQGAQLAGSALDEGQFARLLSELADVRRLGYAISREETEPGLGAVGMPIIAPTGTPLAGISVAVPVGRLDRILEPDRLAQIFLCRDEIVEITRGLDLDSANQ